MTTTRTARQIIDIAISTVEEGQDTTVARQAGYNGEQRLAMCQKMVAYWVGRGWAEAEAQLYALTVLKGIRSDFRGGNANFMGEFTEQMRTMLRDRLTRFGATAYALSEKQFAAAVKLAW